MLDFGKLAETGQAVVEFINQAKAELAALRSVLDEVRQELREHRSAVEPQIANLEMAHKEIMGWIADIEGGEIVEASAAVQAAVVDAELAALTATAAASEAVTAAETVIEETVVPPEETPLPETPPPETPPTPPLEETPIPPPAEPPKERKRHFLKL